jgi:pimeloyl-ACP methyl ester carboxylesterase
VEIKHYNIKDILVLNMSLHSKVIALRSPLPPAGSEVEGGRQLATSIRYYEPSTPDRSAPTVVFLPFWGGSASTFEPVQQALSKTHPTCTSVAVSYRGTGSSSGSSEETSSLTSTLNSEQDPLESHDIPALATDVIALFETLANDGGEQQALIPSRQVVLCAHSMSAKVAWEILHALTSSGNESVNLLDNKRTTTVKGLLLLAPAPPGPLELPAEIREQQLKAYDSLDSALWTLRNVLTHKDLSDQVVGRLATDCVSMSPGAKRGWIELGMKRDCRGVVEDMVARIKADWQREGTFQLRVLVGEKDKVETVEKVKSETVDVLTELGLDVTLTIVPEVGHLLPVEAPEEVAAELGKLL